MKKFLILSFSFGLLLFLVANTQAQTVYKGVMIKPSIALQSVVHSRGTNVHPEDPDATMTTHYVSTKLQIKNSGLITIAKGNYLYVEVKSGGLLETPYGVRAGLTIPLLADFLKDSTIDVTLNWKVGDKDADGDGMLDMQNDAAHNLCVELYPSLAASPPITSICQTVAVADIPED